MHIVSEQSAAPYQPRDVFHAEAQPARPAIVSVGGVPFRSPLPISDEEAEAYNRAAMSLVMLAIKANAA
jgi:hypothetical protein